MWFSVSFSKPIVLALRGLEELKILDEPTHNWSAMNIINRHQAFA